MNGFGVNVYVLRCLQLKLKCPSQALTSHNLLQKQEREMQVHLKSFSSLKGLVLEHK